MTRASKFALAAPAVLLAGLLGAAGTPHRSAVMGKVPLVLGVEDGSPNFTENFNPFSPNHLAGDNYMYEPLTMVNLLNGKQTPWLATSYRWVTKTDLQFTIRQGVKWSNGTPLTVKDVVFTFNLLKKYPALDLNAVWTNLSSVSGSGNTVTFHFKKADIPSWFYIATTPIVSAQQWSKVKNPVAYTDPHPVVTGPFVLQSFHPTQYTLKANPLYWQRSKIHIPAIKSVALSSNTTSDMLMSEGKFDQSVLFTPNIKGTYVNRNPKYYHYWFPLAPPVNLVFNLHQYPFNNVKFRAAMAYAINKQKIWKQGEYGYEPPANQTLLPPSLATKWLNKSLVKEYAYAYNPKRAAALLGQMGLKKNAHGQLIGKNGKQISLTLQVPTGWTDWIQDCQIIRGELGTLGIKVTVITPSVATDYNNVETGHFQAALVYENSNPNPWFIYDYILSSAMSAPVGQVAPFTGNVERYQNPKVNSLLSAYAQTTSAAKQHAIINQLQTIMVKQLPVVALVYGAAWNEYQTNHYVGWPTQQNPYAMPSNTYPDTLLIATHLTPAK